MTLNKASSPRFRLPIVVLVSGNGSNLQAIIDASRSSKNDFQVDIRAVISNRDNAYALERARRAHIPTVILKDADFATREQYDASLQAVLDQYQPELIVLAGFLRILSEKFVNHYPGKIINIHPSLLPKYRGLNTHQRAIDAGDNLHGASVHYVTPELDGGPVIIQAPVPIHPNDSAESLADRVHQVEHHIYPLVIGWIAQQRLKWDINGISLDNQSLTNPIIYHQD